MIHPFTPGDFEGEPWDKARALFPLLEHRLPNLPKQMNGIFAFPVDGMPVVGPLSDRRRLGGGRFLADPRRGGREDRGRMDDGR